MRLKSLSVSVCLIWGLFLSISLCQGEERFTDNGNGTVTDNETGLMWAKEDNQADITMKDAERWARFSFGYTIQPVYDDWRLPTVEELQTLVSKNKKYHGYKTDCGLIVFIVKEIKLSCASIWASKEGNGVPVVFNFNMLSPLGVQSYDKNGCRVLSVRNAK